MREKYEATYFVNGTATTLGHAGSKHMRGQHVGACWFVIRRGNVKEERQERKWFLRVCLGIEIVGKKRKEDVLMYELDILREKRDCERTRKDRVRLRAGKGTRRERNSPERGLGVLA